MKNQQNDQWEPSLLELEESKNREIKNCIMWLTNEKADVRYDHIADLFIRVYENTSDLNWFICSSYSRFFTDSITTICRQKVSVDYISNLKQITPENFHEFVEMKPSILAKLQHISHFPVTLKNSHDSSGYVGSYKPATYESHFQGHHCAESRHKDDYDMFDPDDMPDDISPNQDY